MNIFSDEYTMSQIEAYNLPEGGPFKVNEAVYGWRRMEGIYRLDNYLSVDMRTGTLNVPTYRLRESGLWMSITHMEVQSAYVAIQRAARHETIALGGLGLGYAPLMMADNDMHQQIDIYEESQDCVDLFTKMFSDRPGFDKFTFYVGNCRELLQDKEYDYCFMDIYQNLADSEILDDLPHFIEGNLISEYRYWGQELLVSHCGDEFLEDNAQALRDSGIWTFEDSHLLMDFEASEQSQLRSPFHDTEFAIECTARHLSVLGYPT